jgi:hypothetical protein
MTQQWLAFRSAILPLYLVTLFFTIVGFVGGFLFSHGLAVEVDWDAVGESFLWAAVVVFVFIVAAVLLFRVYVSAEGLRCYTFFGNYHTLSWTDRFRPPYQPVGVAVPPGREQPERPDRLGSVVSGGHAAVSGGGERARGRGTPSRQSANVSLD